MDHNVEREVFADRAAAEARSDEKRKAYSSFDLAMMVDND